MSRSGLYLSLLCIMFDCYCGANDFDNYVEKCTTSGLAGKCKLVTDCPLALESLKSTRTHNLERCGFHGRTEIVCCPEVKELNKLPDSGDRTRSKGDTIQKSRFTKRKSEQACEEISSQTTSKIGLHIIAGEDANIEDFPHMAALGYETDEGIQWDCSASIISKRYLLSAAHCIANIKRILPKIARMGVTKLNETSPRDYVITNITVNPTYNSSSKHNDIALLKVNKDISFSEKIYPACLYFENDDPIGLIITGWGKTSIDSSDDRSNTLQKAILVAVPVIQCNISYFTRSSGSKHIIDSQLCASSNESDACWGDSGGPLQIQNRAGSYSIVGIISYGAGCGGKLPGVYTRVSKYLEWIESIVWP